VLLVLFLFQEEEGEETVSATACASLHRRVSIKIVAPRILT
jgi:hypothetical protein